MNHRKMGTTVFEYLENRVLFSQIHVNDFGASPNGGGDDRGAIQDAINASQPGDTIVFGAGEYHISGAMSFKTSRTYAGADTNTVIDVSNSNYAVDMEGNAENVTIRGITFNGGGVDLGRGSPGSVYRNIRIENNKFNDTNTHAVRATIRTDGLVVDNNEFRNIGGYGVFEIYNPDRLEWTYNRVYNSHHGGHLLSPRQDCVLAYNYMTGLTDWGFEIQQIGGTISQNLLVEGNVVFGFKRAYGNTGGLSVIAERGENTIVRNNYLRADHPGVGLDEPHMHVGIEAGFNSGIVEGNVIGGDVGSGNFTHYITASGPNMLFKDNTFYGTPSWGYTMRDWAGIDGSGWFQDVNNHTAGGYDDMPDPQMPHRDGSSTPIDDDDDEDIDEDTSNNEENEENNNSDDDSAGDDSNTDGGESPAPVDEQPNDEEEQIDSPAPAPTPTPEPVETGSFLEALHHGPLLFDRSATPVASTTSTARSVWLSNVKWSRATNGWGPVETDQSNGDRDQRDGTTLSIDGTTHRKGLGVAINSEVVYNLAGRYQKFFSNIGIDDSAGEKGSVTFQVWADGRKVFDSGVVTHASKARKVSLNVLNVKTLKLVTTDAGDGGNSDHADWAGARLTLAASST